MKNMLLVFLIVCQSLNFAQTQDFSKFLKPLAVTYNLSDSDLSNFTIGNNYYREETQMQHVYLQQTVLGTPIFNAILQLHIRKGDQLVFHNCRFVKDALSKIEPSQSAYTIDQAFEIVKNDLGIEVSQNYRFQEVGENSFLLNCPDFLINPARAKLVYFQQNDQLKLGYAFSLEPKKSAAFSLIISSVDGSILRKQNRTLSCQFDHHHAAVSCDHNNKIHEDGPQRNIGEATYNAYALGIESPLHGPRALLNAVEYPLASPYGWHDIDSSPGAEFTTTRGNNVDAHEDINNMDVPGYSPDGGLDLVFDFPYFEGQEPLLSLDASITNLFVWNNYLHDLSYFYGFDEISGNFQQTNYSGQGSGEDHVFAQAMDGSGTNNANFGTPEEGFNPVMQMYIWEHIEGTLLEITEPVNIAGIYQTGSSTFGVPPPTNPFNAAIILVDDGSINPTQGCNPLLNAAQISGKIAFFDRGTCPFVQKVQIAQDAGAIAAIIANNQQGGPMSMGGDDFGAINIPVLSISENDGTIVKAQLSNNTTVLANFGGDYTSSQFDSSFDNGIIAHEYGHGISNRLTGGSFQVDCLWNEEQMGEGWSDFFALIISDTLGTNGLMPRGIGNFASNLPADAFGIRPFPYTTDMNVNPLTYQTINQLSIPHGVGSVWATMLWDLYWAFVNEYGHSNEMYSDAGGNNRVIRLVMEGMRLQACSPGFIDGRDAILAADEFLYDGINQCLIWETFARRGLGFSADQGSSSFVGDEIEAFDMPLLCSQSASLTNLEKSEFTIFPNPGNDQISIKSQDNHTIEAVCIFNVSGNLVLQLEPNTSNYLFAVSNLSKGLYFIEIQSNKTIQRLPWVKM